MYRFRWTIKELQGVSNKKLIQSLITERQSSCTNPYSPLAQRLRELEKWVEANVKEVNHETTSMP